MAAEGNRVVATTDGTIEGRIIDESRGNNGFGYDPHFLVPELSQTTPELPPDQKKRISHPRQRHRRVLPATQLHSPALAGPPNTRPS